MFSRRHYRILAKVIKEENTGVSEGVEYIENAIYTASLVSRLCEIFAQDNPLFNEKSFVEACGLC